jgi:hypothetical protein
MAYFLTIKIHMTVTTLSRPLDGVKTSKTKTTNKQARKQKRLLYIPADLKFEINQLVMSPQSRDCCLNLACYIYRAFQNKREKDSLWVSLSQIHFEKNVSTYYSKALKSLKDAKIVECLEYYRYTEVKGQGVCKKYRINPELLDAELVPVRYTSNEVEYEDNPIIQKTLKELQKLKIVIGNKVVKSESDILKLKATIEADISMDWFFKNNKVNDLQPNKVYSFCFWNSKDTHDGNTFSQKGEKLIQLAKEYKKDAVLYKSRVFLADDMTFARYKIGEIRSKIWNSLIAIHDGAWVCKRNDTNRRLDTNLTNLKSDYIDFLRYEGEQLVSIDLKNSQFVIFAHLLEACWNQLCCLNENQVKKILSEPQNLALMEKIGFNGERMLKENVRDTETLKGMLDTMCQEFFTNGSFSMSSDCLKFIELTKSGKFYEAFGDILNDSELDENLDEATLKAEKKRRRANAKQIMFLVAFSSHNYHSDDKKKFENAFPVVSNIIKGFKREMEKAYIQRFDRDEAVDKAGAAFAVMLQNIESAIFIDGLLPKLWKAGFKVFTKHDCFLVKESQAEAAKAFIISELDKLFGEKEYMLGE